MTYLKKRFSMDKSEFAQLNIYIKLVSETVQELKERQDKNFKMDDWLKALCIHQEILDDYTAQMIKRHKLTSLPDIGE